MNGFFKRLYKTVFWASLSLVVWTAAWALFSVSTRYFAVRDKPQNIRLIEPPNLTWVEKARFRNDFPGYEEPNKYEIFNYNGYNLINDKEDLLFALAVSQFIALILLKAWGVWLFFGKKPQS